MTLKDPFINNYYVHSQRGKSSIFTNFLASEYIYICLIPHLQGNDILYCVH